VWLGITKNQQLHIAKKLTELVLGNLKSDPVPKEKFNSKQIYWKESN